MNALLPGTLVNGQPVTLGVMGGGQLGRMFVHAAQAMGYFTAVLDPDPASPAGRVSHYHIQTDYLDEQGLAQLLQRSAAITTEFENVPAPALHTLGAHRFVAPAADAVAIAQDRAAEKAHFVRCGVPVAPYALIETEAQLQSLLQVQVQAQAQAADASAALLPGILKTTRLGYDGKGQRRVNTPAELQAAWQALGGVPCVLEKRLALQAECSVIVARSAAGGMVGYPAQRNLHRDGILAVTEAYPGAVESTLAQQVEQATRAIAEGLGYVGVLCVEFFVLANGQWVVNEMAPRPHNSGHYTLDACDQSQFDLQVRTLTGLPLTAPRQHSAAVMLNLLGDLWLAPTTAAQPARDLLGSNPDLLGSDPDLLGSDPDLRSKLGSDPNTPTEAKTPTEATPPWPQVLALPGTHLHLYGKLSPRVGRKMGHLTITAATPEQARATALQACALLGIAPF